MLAVELVVPAEGARLMAHSPAQDLVWPDSVPMADLYIIGFDPPATGTYRDRSIRATERIAQQLVEHQLVSQYIRRIA
jgi:hypothetical protein